MNFQEMKNSRELFRVEALGDGITRIRDLMGAGMYLVEGKEKAALLDTGHGIGDVRPLINLLTDRPVEVYLTHGHVDHGGGMYAFEKVFVTAADQELLRWHTTPQLRLDFASAYDPQLRKVTDIFEHMPFRDMETERITPGDTIDLGGRTLEVTDLRGHTAGSVGFLDRMTGILFAGDGCNASTFLFLRESVSVSEYCRMLKELKQEWMPYVKRILICHGESMEAPLTVADDLIECCERVMDGKGCQEEFLMPYVPFRNGRAFWAAAGEDDRIHTDGVYGNLIYCESNI